LIALNVYLKNREKMIVVVVAVVVVVVVEVVVVHIEDVEHNIVL